MLNSKPLNKLIFLDIETVPQHKSFFDMSERMQELFLKRFKRDSEKLTGLERDDWNVKDLDTPELRDETEKLYRTKAPLQPEFLKIVCISIGYIKNEYNTIELPPKDDVINVETTSFYGDDEKELLQKFYMACASVLKKGTNHLYHMVAHNGKNFDFPVIAKRMILNDFTLPPFFDISGRKPWDLEHLVDTKDAWKFGVYDANVSLDLLCEVFGVPTSKDDIDGSQVRDVYYEEGDLERIAKYCAKDVVANIVVYLRMLRIKNKVNEI